MLEAKIILLLAEHGGLNSFQICRLINNKTIDICRESRDLAKTFRQYKRYGHREACKFCEIPYSKVRSALEKLVRKGLVKKERRRVPDRFCTRGYDFHNIYSLTPFTLRIIQSRAAAGVR